MAGQGMSVWQVMSIWSKASVFGLLGLGEGVKSYLYSYQHLDPCLNGLGWSVVCRIKLLIRR